MGGSSSAPRSLTLEQEPNGVVKVSEAVARRLVGKPESLPAVEPKQEANNFISADEKNEELQNLQKRYERRISALEKQNKELHTTSTSQFASAVEEVEKKFLTTTRAPICDDLEVQVMKCYQDNPTQTLSCSKLVRSYATCVQDQRQNILTKKDCQPCMLAQMARGPCGVAFMKAYDCYLDDTKTDEDKEVCGELYLEMKQCWDNNPDYGYQKIIDKAYADGPPKGKKPADKPKNDENKPKNVENKPKNDENKPVKPSVDNKEDVRKVS